MQIGGSAPAINLGPPGDSGFHHVLFHVRRDLVLELVYEDRALGPRANDGHVTPENVDELGEFIKACLSKESAGSSGATLTGLRPHGA